MRPINNIILTELASLIFLGSGCGKDTTEVETTATFSEDAVFCEVVYYPFQPSNFIFHGMEHVDKYEVIFQGTRGKFVIEQQVNKYDRYGDGLTETRVWSDLKEGDSVVVMYKETRMDTYEDVLGDYGKEKRKVQSKLISREFLGAKKK